MMCWKCGSEMEGSRETITYDDCGVPGIVLEGVNVYRCAECGESGTAIAHTEALHEQIAHSLARRPGRLGPQEIRFLREWLGYSSKEFAKIFKVDKSTVSRWERVDAPKPIGPRSELLLRGLVLTGKPLEAELDEVPPALHFVPSDHGWKFKAA